MLSPEHQDSHYRMIDTMIVQLFHPHPSDGDLDSLPSSLSTSSTPSSPSFTSTSPAPSSSTRSAFEHLLDASASASPTSSECHSSASATFDQPKDSAFIRINGRKEYGPPANWSGPPPPAAAELFVRRIPRTMAEQQLFAAFRHFGRIYRIRLMVDFDNTNRGFGYVHFARLADANAALQQLPHCHVLPNVQLHVERSYDKCRLFVSRLPVHWPAEAVRRGLHEHFDEVRTVTVAQPPVAVAGGPSVGNRGFAFMDFETHDAAIRAKQLAATGRIRLFDQDVQVIWAKPLGFKNYAANSTHEPMTVAASAAAAAPGTSCTLIVHNVDEALRHQQLWAVVGGCVNGALVDRVKRIDGDRAVVVLYTHEAAQLLAERLHGLVVMSRMLKVQWVSDAPVPVAAAGPLPSSDNPVTALRLVCVANGWSEPIYLCGRVCTQTAALSQYVCVIMNNGSFTATLNTDTAPHCVLFMNVRLSVGALQSRVADVTLQLVRHWGGMPPSNAVLLVEPDDFAIVGNIVNLATFEVLPRASAYTGSPAPSHPSLTVNWTELYHLSQCVRLLLPVPTSDLMRHCKRCLLLTPESRPSYAAYSYAYVCLQTDGRRIGCIVQQSPAADDSLDQLLLVACDASTGRNYGAYGSDGDAEPSFGGQPETTTATAGNRTESVEWLVHNLMQNALNDNFVVFFG